MLVHLWVQIRQIKANLDRKRKRYIKKKRVKNRILTVLCLFCFSLLFSLFFFLTIFQRQIMAFIKIHLQVILLWASMIFDFYLKLRIHVNFFSSIRYSFSPEVTFFTHSKQKSFFIQRSILNIVKLKVNLRSECKTTGQKKHRLKVIISRHILYQKYGTWLFLILKLRHLDIFCCKNIGAWSAQDFCYTYSFFSIIKFSIWKTYIKIQSHIIKHMKKLFVSNIKTPKVLKTPADNLKA